MVTSSRSNPKVRLDHLERPAFVYVRQSTLFQIRENTASTARQYDLVQRAQELGWSSASITLADALEEAGCTNPDMLNHCRQPGEHVRGCRCIRDCGTATIAWRDRTCRSLRM
jgi:hypothetical protein